MKKFLLIAFVTLIAGGLWSYHSYPALGHLLYTASMAGEASIYGFKERRVDIGELEMSLYQGGKPEQPTLLMLHGYSADKNVWLRFAKHFVDDYHVIIPDMAGHGDTAFVSGGDYSISAQSRRLQGLLDALHIDQVHIIGNSMGGFISADFSLSYPERVLTTGLVDPAGVNSPEPSTMQKLLAEGRNPFLVEKRDQFREFYAMTMAKPPWMPGVVLDAMAEDYQQRRTELAEIFNDFHSTALLEPRLASLRSPALLLWGSEDQLIHVSSVDTWRTAIPTLEVTVWEGIGHMPMLEIPAESAARYQQFLTKYSESAQ